MKTRVIAFALVSAGIFLLFQNFSSYTALQSHIDPDRGDVRRVSGDWKYHDQIRNKHHEVKLSGGGKVPKMFHYRRFGKTFLWFETRGNGSSKDRSEIRIVGSDAPFDQTYYTGFKVYYPSWADKIDRRDWAILWQCAQAGDYSTPRSPPLSIQFKNNTLSVKSHHNYDSRDRVINHEQRLAPFRRNRWVKVFMRYRLGQRGHYKVWINNRVVAEVRRPIGYKDGINPFTGLKSCSARFGVYKKGSRDRVALLFDDVKVGTHYGSVRPD